MRHAVGLAEPGPFQFDPLREHVEQLAAAAEQDSRRLLTVDQLLRTRAS
jgi:hypothetical protein